MVMVKNKFGVIKKKEMEDKDIIGNILKCRILLVKKNRRIIILFRFNSFFTGVYLNKINHFFLQMLPPIS